MSSSLAQDEPGEWRSDRLAGGFKPVLGYLGTESIDRRTRVAVPQLGHVELHDVEPLRLGVRSVPRLVLGRGALVGQRGDLARGPAHVLGRTAVEDHGQFAHHNPIADRELRLAGKPGVHSGIALADRTNMVLVVLDVRTVADRLRLCLKLLAREAMRSLSSVRPM